MDIRTEASSGHAALWREVPAIASGMIVALSWLTLGVIVPAPRGNGFLAGILGLVHATTVPYFHMAFGFVAGWIAIATFGAASMGRAALLGGYVGLTYGLCTWSAWSITGVDIDGTQLLVGAGLAPLGSLAARFAGSQLGDMFIVGRLLKGVEGPSRWLWTILVSMLALVLLFVAYAVALVALFVALALFVLYVGLRIIAFMSGSEAPSVGGGLGHIPLWGGANASREKEDWLGDKRVEHTDQRGDVVMVSREKEDWLGDKRVEHTNMEGDVVQVSREKQDWLGDKRVEHTNMEGDVVQVSREKQDWFGDEYTEHENREGDVVAESREKRDWFGERYAEHTRRRGK